MEKVVLMPEEIAAGNLFLSEAGNLPASK